MDDFVEKLDRIEPPGQLVSLLADPLLQKYVDLKPTPTNTARIGIWLAACLEEQFEVYRQGAGDDQYLHEILDGFLRYAQYAKVSLPDTLVYAKLIDQRHCIPQCLRFCESSCRHGTEIWVLIPF